MNKKIITASAVIGFIYLVPRFLRPIITLQEKKIKGLENAVANTKKITVLCKLKKTERGFSIQGKDRKLLMQDVVNEQTVTIEFIILRPNKVFFALPIKYWKYSQRPIDGTPLPLLPVYSTKIDEFLLSTAKKMTTTNKGEIMGNAIGININDFYLNYNNEAYIILHQKTGAIEMVKNINNL